MSSVAKRLLVLLLCISLLMIPLPASADDIYFTSVNDSVLPLTAETMPTWSGGILYVPYTVFDSSVTGVSLGLYCNYNRSTETVMLINLSQILTFDLNANTCMDTINNVEYKTRAIMRNGRPYVPVNLVCTFFGLTPSYNTVSLGYLVRIKNNSAILSDSKFIDAATNLMSYRLREYNATMEPSQPSGPVQSAPGQTPSTSTPSTPAPTPSAPATTPAAPAQPAPTTPEPQPQTPEKDPEPEDKTDDEEEEEPEPERPTPVTTYLALACTTDEEVSSILDTLSGSSRFGVFFLTPDLLESQAGLVRRILGTGQILGIDARGASEEETRALLTRGSQCLEQIAHTRTSVVLAESEFRGTLESEGWICWNETHTLTPVDEDPSFYATSTLSRMEGRVQPAYLLLTGSETPRILSALLKKLEEKNFVVTLPLETIL